MKKKLLTSMLFCSLASLGFSDLSNSVDGNSYTSKMLSKKIQPPKQLNNNMKDIESQRKKIKKIKPKIKENNIDGGQQEIGNMTPPIRPKEMPPHQKINDQQKGADDEYSNLTTNLQPPKKQVPENMQHNLNLLSDEDRKLNRQMMFDGPQEGFQNNKPRGI
ncbi:hypothetical protein EDC55_11034 [Allofrancisella inopinata]|uniref:Uncharacterized protein n=1 Tax=Allofrancisella inopinata TaxID=1085647 RepID=A0AAE6YHM9_9GAMM|nr:hypothetical protein [Allofrancisella inopinata]QIV96043.1 hypothetical protein E4K63_04050 [Allofrancisella inopinata]TDT71701.1 hypothetical protein EDC55_11034 [Allofrancisella inopinata]